MLSLGFQQPELRRQTKRLGVINCRPSTQYAPPTLRGNAFAAPTTRAPPIKPTLLMGSHESYVWRGGVPP